MPNKKVSADSTYRLAIVHWFPLEQFPPAQNIINFFSDHPEFSVLCCTTQRSKEQFPYSNNKTRLIRSPFPSQNFGKLLRLYFFLSFPIYTFLKLIFFRPHFILYVEPHSAPAVFPYSLLFRGCRIFSHYHEYRDPNHLSARGNFLARFGNWLERLSLFRRAEWISHTNEDRIRLFLRDYPGVIPQKMHALPNMPPRKWLGDIGHVTKGERNNLKLVYIGAISLHDTYIETLLKWFSKVQRENVTLDLYINNIDSATESFLAKYKQEGLSVHIGGVPYNQLPTILPKYDVGLILYRCNTINYVYNAPNKLFEYLACGLNVIYPRQMLGVLPYARSDYSPWVRAVDFEQLHQLSIHEVTNWDCPFKTCEYYCETVYQSLMDRMCSG